MRELPVPRDFVESVDERELLRLLGYPPDCRPADVVSEVIAACREVFAVRARPRVLLCQRDDGVAAAITAGREVEEVVGRLWREDRADEAYVLDRVAVAVVEELARFTRRELLSSGPAVRPHRSPGYDGWPLDNQRALFAPFEPNDAVRMLPSGMLSPVSSLLALYAYGEDAGERETRCSECGFRPCRFRRAA